MAKKNDNAKGEEILRMMADEEVVEDAGVNITLDRGTPEDAGPPEEEEMPDMEVPEYRSDHDGVEMGSEEHMNMPPEPEAAPPQIVEARPAMGYRGISGQTTKEPVGKLREQHLKREQDKKAKPNE